MVARRKAKELRPADRRIWPAISKFERAAGKTPMDCIVGFQLARTDELTLLCAISDFVIPDGFSVHRNSLITKTSGKAKSSVFGLALELKGYLPPAKPDLDLRSMRHCLQDLQKKKIFVALHFEYEKPDVAYLGNITGVSNIRVRLRCVTPSGETEPETTGFSIAECTRVDFFGEYERAIQLSALFLTSNHRADRKPSSRKTR
jgi:hypothetical protein